MLLVIGADQGPVIVGLLPFLVHGVAAGHGLRNAVLKGRHARVVVGAVLAQPVGRVGIRSLGQLLPGNGEFISDSAGNIELGRRRDIEVVIEGGRDHIGHGVQVAGRYRGFGQINVRLLGNDQVRVDVGRRGVEVRHIPGGQVYAEQVVCVQIIRAIREVRHIGEVRLQNGDFCQIGGIRRHIGAIEVVGQRVIDKIHVVVGGGFPHDIPDIDPCPALRNAVRVAYQAPGFLKQLA